MALTRTVRDMKFFSDIRLLLLGVWLGAAVFFIGVAQTAFSVLPQRDLAGAVVNRSLTILNFAGIAIAVILIITSLLSASKVNQLWLWVERFLLLIVAAACAVGQFAIGLWMASIRMQIGKPIDELAADDPMRIQFDTLHSYSEWVLVIGMVAALLAFFIISNRKFRPLKDVGADVYDFKKEFKV